MGRNQKGFLFYAKNKEFFGIIFILSIHFSRKFVSGVGA
jgi:hypothetical protein